MTTRLRPAESFRPYAVLEQHLDEFHAEERGLGSLYLARGRRAAPGVARVTDPRLPPHSR